MSAAVPSIHPENAVLLDSGEFSEALKGYLPVKTYSLHHFAHPGLARAVGDYLEQERRAIDQDQAMLAEHSPFRHETDD